MAALATLFDSRLSLWAKAHGQPPTFAAYQEFIRGLDGVVQFDSRGAIVHFRRAAQEDTTFRLPLIFAAHEHMDLGEFATADSIAQAVERAPGRLSPLDEHYLRWVLAQVRGDRQHALETAREMVTIAPNSETLWLGAARGPPPPSPGSRRWSWGGTSARRTRPPGASGPCGGWRAGRPPRRAPPRTGSVSPSPTTSAAGSMTHGACSRGSRRRRRRVRPTTPPCDGSPSSPATRPMR